MATQTEHRKKLELRANVPQDVRFKFPKPLTCEGQHGPYELWTVVVDGEDHTLFASNALQAALREAAPSAGEVLRLTKTERGNGKGFDYTVERPEGSGSTGPTLPRSTEAHERPTANGEDRESAQIRAYVHRYVAICKELSRQWPELHEKDPEMFRTGVHTIYIQLGRS